MRQYANSRILELIRCLCCSVAVLSPGPAISQSPSILPVDIEIPFVSPPALGDGLYNLVYEIHLTNYWRKHLVLEQVEVIDQGTGAAIRSISGEELGRSLFKPRHADDPSDVRLVECGRVVVVYLWLKFEATQQMPDRLYHRLHFSVAGSNGKDQRQADGGVIALPSAEPVKISSPFRAGNWLIGGGPSNTSEHRRAVLAVDGQTSLLQRFAFDAMQVDEDGRVVEGDLSLNHNWRSYGEALIAVADGTVVHVVDGIPDNTPLSPERAVPMNRETHVGNCVVLKVGQDQFVLYAHLKSGSIPVKPGKRISKGDVIGQIGNSGNSEAPHLHFSIGTRPDPYSAEGLPFVVDAFEIIEVFNPGEEALLTAGFGADVIAEAPRSRRKNEMFIGDPLVGFE